MKDFNVDLYVFPGPAVRFDHETCFLTEKYGAYMGIKFEEGEPLIRVVFGPDNTDTVSWQDHGLPQEYCELMGLNDPEEHYCAPGYIPYSLLNGHDRGDKIVLAETDKVRVVATIEDRQGVPFDTDFTQLLETALSYLD